ncbi:MAG: ABC transporter permease [Armatimonadota bacterium]|nr:ABC transporter permease [Armatimonadota bacterium]
MSRVKSLQQVADSYAPLVFLVVLGIALAASTKGFATTNNFLNLARQHSIIIVLAVGQTMVMISGGIDLSVGSVLALSGVVAGLTAANQVPIGVCAALGLATGCLCGFINGLVTAKARVPAFIATLGMMGMARGVALVLSGGVSIDLPPQVSSWTAAHSFAMAVVFVCAMFTVALTWHLILTRTVLGRQCYAIGGSREAARLSGINIDRHTVVIFTLNGLIAGLAGMMMVAYITVADPTAGEGYELDSIAAAVIGGTSLFGGRGKIGGTIVGAFILAVLRNGCDLRNISEHWQRFVVGLMTILAVFYDRMRRRE